MLGRLCFKPCGAYAFQLVSQASHLVEDKMLMDATHVYSEEVKAQTLQGALGT